MRAAPVVERVSAAQPSLLRRSLAKSVAPTARMTGMVPTMSEACETVVSERPLNWKRNWRGTPRKEARRSSAPLGGVEARAVGDEQGEKAERGEDEAVEDHRAYAHLVECDLAEEEAATPEGAGEDAARKPRVRVLGWDTKLFR